MKAGPLTSKVLLQNQTNANTTDGGFAPTWANLSPATVWAAIQPAAPSDAENVTQNTVRPSITHLVTIRYHSGVTTKTRITYKARYLYVRGIEDVDVKRETTRLSCQEAVA